jgi:Leucine-rich repeat (LRR) protein
VLENAEKVEVLNLANNRFKTIPEEILKFKNLKKLNLMSNRLTFLGNNLTGLSKLELVIVAENKITSADALRLKLFLPDSRHILWELTL